jgi:ABC-2 type transport system permease protein
MLAVVQVIMAYMFLIQLDAFVQLQPQLAAREGAPGVTDIVIAPLFGNAAVVLLLVAPLLTMRLISEERRSQSLALLFSAPVSMTAIILGKYTGIVAFFFVMLALIVLMPLTLLLSGNAIDVGKFVAGVMGLALMIASFAALGLFMSALTSYPGVAAVSSFGVLLLLWIIDWAGDKGATGGLFGYLSLVRHYESFLKGVFNSADVLYYLLFIITFLVLAIRRLDADRLQD